MDVKHFWANLLAYTVSTVAGMRAAKLPYKVPSQFLAGHLV